VVLSALCYSMFPSVHHDAISASWQLSNAKYSYDILVIETAHTHEVKKCIHLTNILLHYQTDT